MKHALIGLLIFMILTACSSKAQRQISAARMKELHPEYYAGYTLPKMETKADSLLWEANAAQDVRAYADSFKVDSVLSNETFRFMYLPIYNEAIFVQVTKGQQRAELKLKVFDRSFNVNKIDTTFALTFENWRLLSDRIKATGFWNATKRPFSRFGCAGELLVLEGRNEDSSYHFILRQCPNKKKDVDFEKIGDHLLELAHYKKTKR